MEKRVQEHSQRRVRGLPTVRVIFSFVGLRDALERGRVGIDGGGLQCQERSCQLSLERKSVVVFEVKEYLLSIPCTK